jgi:two-component system, OmpR family, sensor kinase
MKIQGSIAAKLSFALTAFVSVLWLVSVGISSYVLSHELDEAFNNAMRQSALRLLPLAIQELDKIEEYKSNSDDHDDDDDDDDDDYVLVTNLQNEAADLSYFITDKQGRIVMRAGDAHELNETAKIPLGFSKIGKTNTFSLTDPETGFGIVVTEELGLREKVWSESIGPMLFPLAILIPFLIISILVIVRFAMKPVLNLQQAVANRHGRNLAPLDIGPQPKELAPIVQEVDKLLIRLKAALEAERNFAAESAHELRTPIAGALAQVQVLASQITDPKHADHLAKTEQSLRNLSKLSESLLQFSRLEAGFAISETLTDILEVAALVLHETPFKTAKNRLRITDNSGGKLQAFITPDAFAIILRNLLQNALKYADADSGITLTYNSNGLSIINNCPVVPADRLSELTKRFVRGSTGAGGTGLGLAIVSSIIADCGGTLNLKSPATGQSSGFEATVEFAAK